MARRLRSDGLRLWFAPWEIRAGDHWPSAIEEGLRSSRVLVKCLSAAAAESDWVTLETSAFRVHDPLNRTNRFVPVRLDDAPIKTTLRQFQHVDWAQRDEDEYQRLLEACRLPGGAGSDPDPETSDESDGPALIRGMERDADDRAAAGDVWGAEELYLEAAQTLVNAEQAGDHIRVLREKARINRELGELLRLEYRGESGPAPIKVFDESGAFVRSATKFEVHDQGLHHRSALLLVQDQLGRAVYYQRAPEQTYAGRYDFLGGHMSDRDDSPRATALREADEELRLSVRDHRLPISAEWLHQVGAEDQFESFSPNDREKSTLFVITLQPHPALEIQIKDEAADGIQLLDITTAASAPFQELLRDDRSGVKKFASGAERVFMEYERDPAVKQQIDSLF